jgi:hypothetical protein
MDENDLRETPNHRWFSISLQKDILDLHPRAGGMGWTTPCLSHEAGESNDNPWNRGNPEAEMSGLRLNRTSGVTSPRGLPMEMIWLCGNDLQAKAQVSTEPDHFHRQFPQTSYI